MAEKNNINIRIKDIAERAGVSAGTVDRVIHERGEVSPETRKAVLDIIDELQYSPNILASSLATSRRWVAAVLIPEASKENPFWEEHLRGVRRAAIELMPFGLDMEIFTFSMAGTSDFRDKSARLLKSAPDCVLIAPVFYNESVNFLRKCNNKKVPYAFIDSPIDQFEPVCFIGQNSCQSGTVAGKLLRLGNNPNGLYLVFNISREKDQLRHLSDREKGFRLFFENRGEAPEIITHIIGDETLSSLKSVLQKYSGKKNILSGIFVTGSKVNLVAQVLESLKMKEVRLVGYDLTEKNKKYLRRDVIDFLISQQPEEQGYLGITCLFNSIVKKKDVEPVHNIPIDIITRENLEQYPKCR